MTDRDLHSVFSCDEEDCDACAEYDKKLEEE